jgi:hypothetical protein
VFAHDALEDVTARRNILLDQKLISTPKHWSMGVGFTQFEKHKLILFT